MTRAERYKRNYRIIKNTYQDTTLAKSAQTWSDDRLYSELGIKVENKKTPDLKQIQPERKAYYTRKLNKYLYARSVGFDVKESRKFTSYKKQKIESSYTYQDVSNKKRNFKNRKRRLKLWGEWSDNITGNMPPEIEKQARDRNRATSVGGKRLDDFNSYGYVVAFYQFVQGRTFDEIKEFVNPDPHDSLRIRYEVTVRAI